MINEIIIPLTIAGSLVLVGIISLQITFYRKVRSQYGIFMIVFASLFLLQNLVSLYFYFTLRALYLPAVEWHVMILAALQLISFVYLLWISLK
ncbi:MAG: hypothetical protein GXP63_00550 [DPANN group archaeon]|nr:hypothetical protein [DPANN group archaeon]